MRSLIQEVRDTAIELSEVIGSDLALDDETVAELCDAHDALERVEALLRDGSL